ncbi:surface lipoprotein assembly modifier [Zavarzinia sp.]|uniref:surface lipoprotein assembly modifier n=1 Tax=Zavarzinia sp. TaxID=2027920 RepID=UPI0035698092
MTSRILLAATLLAAGVLLGRPAAALDGAVPLPPEGAPAPVAAPAEPTEEQLQTEAEFRQGLLAVAAGQYDDAAQIFDDILARDPDLVRVRLELARALFLAGDQDDRARFQFERVLAGDLPEAVKQNVERFLDAIRQRRSWTLEAEVAIVPDSNINGGANSREVNIGGLPFFLNESSAKKSGVGLLTSVNGSYRFNLPGRWRFQTQGAYSQHSYDDRQYDDSILSWGAGPRYLFERGEIGLAFVGYYRWLGLDPYSMSLGAQLTGNYLLTRRLRIEATTRIAEVSSYLPGGREGPTYDASLTLRYALSPRVLVYASVDTLREDFDAAALADTTAGVSAGIYGDLPWGFSAGASYRYGETDYDGVQPIFNTDRKDTNWQVSTTLLNRKINVWKVTPIFRYTHVNNQSNLSIYEYSRDIYEIGLTKEF